MPCRARKGIASIEQQGSGCRKLRERSAAAVALLRSVDNRHQHHRAAHEWAQGRMPEGLTAVLIASAVRRASAAMVSVGLAVPDVGNSEDPANHRFG